MLNPTVALSSPGQKLSVRVGGRITAEQAAIRSDTGDQAVVLEVGVQAAWLCTFAGMRFCRLP